MIVGGGASGLAAALELRMMSSDIRLTVLEKNNGPGRKIRATGSGRCNISNTSAEGYEEICDFFRRIGLMTREYPNGLVYPYSESAADVVRLLVTRARERGVRFVTDAEVTGITELPGSGFETSYMVKNDRPHSAHEGRTSRKTVQKIRSRYLILASGGKAGPEFGTTGDGYRLARELGHSIVTPVPVLTSVECMEWDSDSIPCGITLAGTRTRGVVSLNDGDLFSEAGEIQFTRYGLSGICVFNMTRHMRYDRKAGESITDFTITADLCPDGDIEDFLRYRRSSAFEGEKAREALMTVLKENIASYVLDSAGIVDIPLAELTDEDISRISDAVHRLTFHPTGIRGWKEAQATSGGVTFTEIDPDTCSSRIVKGLYITGELADRDFPCGGFNLSNAWLTGMRAARSIADSYIQE